jgi:hypothetical protein
LSCCAPQLTHPCHAQDANNGLSAFQTTLAPGNIVRVLVGTQPSVNNLDLRVVQARLRVLPVALSF